jgi:hypothetical protein
MKNNYMGTYVGMRLLKEREEEKNEITNFGCVVVWEERGDWHSMMGLNTQRLLCQGERVNTKGCGGTVVACFGYGVFCFG